MAAPDSATAARLADLERQLRGALDSIADLAKEADKRAELLTEAQGRIKWLTETILSQSASRTMETRRKP
jgi:hypothetical protein